VDADEVLPDAGDEGDRTLLEALGRIMSMIDAAEPRKEPERRRGARAEASS